MRLHWALAALGGFRGAHSGSQLHHGLVKIPGSGRVHQHVGQIPKLREHANERL